MLDILYSLLIGTIDRELLYFLAKVLRKFSQHGKKSFYLRFGYERRKSLSLN